MDTAEQFKTLAAEWERHCRGAMFSSFMADYLKHPAYQKLVALGRPAIPYIIERYRSDQLPWGFVLQEITGVRMIEEPKRFSPAEVRDKWLAWWEKEQDAPQGIR